MNQCMKRNACRELLRELQNVKEGVGIFILSLCDGWCLNYRICSAFIVYFLSWIKNSNKGEYQSSLTSNCSRIGWIYAFRNIVIDEHVMETTGLGNRHPVRFRDWLLVVWILYSFRFRWSQDFLQNWFWWPVSIWVTVKLKS